MPPFRTPENTLHSINRVLDLRNAICQSPDLQIFLDKELRRESFEEFVRLITAMLPGDLRVELVRKSLLHLAGQTLTKEILYEHAWRLAGNTQRLKSLRPIYPWNKQVVEEYVPLQVIGAEYAPRYRKPAYNFSFRVLAGTPAGMMIHKNWSAAFCGMLSRRMGFSRSWGKTPYRSPSELFGMRFYVILKPQLCGVRPDFEEVWIDQAKNLIKPASCLEYNQVLLKWRRREGYVCPGGFADAQVCHLCSFGQDKCVVSTHALTYVVQECPVCKQSAWFDPAWPTRKTCVACTNKELARQSHS